jgi:hypothetical protein
MFDTVIIETPVGPDPEEVRKFAGAANSNQDNLEPPPQERWNFSNDLGLRKKKKSVR